MRRNIIKALTLAFMSLTVNFLTIWVQVLMIFKLVITKTFSLWANHFTLNIFQISPAQIEPIFAFLGDWQELLMIDIKFFKFL
jgi:hypothetical protein